MGRGRTLDEIRRHYSPEAVAERRAAEAGKAESKESCAETSSTASPLHHNCRSFVDRVPLSPVAQRGLREVMNQARAARVAQSVTQFSRAADAAGLSMEEIARVLRTLDNKVHRQLESRGAARGD